MSESRYMTQLYTARETLASIAAIVAEAGHPAVDETHLVAVTRKLVDELLTLRRRACASTSSD